MDNIPFAPELLVIQPTTSELLQLEKLKSLDIQIRAKTVDLTKKKHLSEDDLQVLRDAVVE